MHMVIDIQGWQCGEDHCRVTGGAPGLGHTVIGVRNAAQPHWQRRPPWAELAFDIRPPKGASEVLRWAVRTLNAHVSHQPTSPFDDDDWDNCPPLETDVLKS